MRGSTQSDFTATPHPCANFTPATSAHASRTSLKKTFHQKRLEPAHNSLILLSTTPKRVYETSAERTPSRGTFSLVQHEQNQHQCHPHLHCLGGVSNRPDHAARHTRQPLAGPCCFAFHRQNQGNRTDLRLNSPNSLPPPRYTSTMHRRSFLGTSLLAPALFTRLSEAVQGLELVSTHEHLASEEERYASRPDFFVLADHYAISDLVSAGLPADDMAPIRDRSQPAASAGRCSSRGGAMPGSPGTARRCALR
jgi:hypothetical protein